MRNVIAGLCVLVLPLPVAAQSERAHPPIIDVHQHALPATFWGTPDPDWFPDYVDRAPSDSALLEETLATMRRFNIVKAVTSGPARWADRWHAADPQRIVRASNFADACTPERVEALRELHANGGYRVMGEISWQIAGVAFDDARVEPCFALAEELGIPMGIHVGLLFKGAHIGRYRAGGGRPLDLEDMLLRHPDVRVYLMHAGWPLLDETIALLHAHPQAYVDIALINWYVPRAAFHRYLEALVDAGFGKRIMYGSDSGVWPEAIRLSIEAVESAEFLNEAQKRDIFFNNAARFLRLDAMEGGTP